MFLVNVSLQLSLSHKLLVTLWTGENSSSAGVVVVMEEMISHPWERSKALVAALWQRERERECVCVLNLYIESWPLNLRIAIMTVTEANLPNKE